MVKIKRYSTHTIYCLLNYDWVGNFQVQIQGAEMGRRKVSPSIRMYMPVKGSGRGMSKRGGACVREAGVFVVPETRQAWNIFHG